MNMALGVYEVDNYAGDVNYRLVDVIVGVEIPEKYKTSRYITKLVYVIDFYKYNPN